MDHDVGRPAVSGGPALFPERESDARAARAKERRDSFDEVAGLYDRVRPSYPAALISDLIERGGIRPGTRILEIGCGTGQLTRSLAESGASISALELGSRLADVASDRLARFSNVRVLNAAFEEWLAPSEPFDLVAAATSFHWLSRTTRVSKCAMALRPGGILAIIDQHHVEGGTSQFFADAQRCYLRWDPETRVGFRLPSVNEVRVDLADLEDSPSFGPGSLDRYEWSACYTDRTYCDLLSTYSDVRALEPARRDGLLDCIGELMRVHYGGEISKRYLTELRLAVRLPPSEGAGPLA